MSRLIDADALSRIVKLAWETSDSEDFEKSVFIAIATAPTIEERKRGKWIVIEYPDIYVCPFCKYASSKKNFCGTCGADLRGEEND